MSFRGASVERRDEDEERSVPDATTIDGHKEARDREKTGRHT